MNNKTYNIYVNILKSFKKIITQNDLFDCKIASIATD